MRNENAALRVDNAAMAAELAGFSPQFLDELEELKYAYAAARKRLEQYERTFGPLPDA